MRWRALQNGQIYIRQHPDDTQLSVEDLHDMVGRDGEAFSSRVLHYASTLRGTRQYWMKRLIAMVDTLGLPTVFFTHSAADSHWPELARLICPDDPDSSTNCSKAVVENPAIADCFFHSKVHGYFLHWSSWCYRLLDVICVAESWQPTCTWFSMASQCT